MNSTPAREGTTIRGHMNIFPKDVQRDPNGTEKFNPHPRSVVYPTAPIGRNHGDRRAPLRAVEFDVAADEFFTVLRELERGAARSTTVSAGSFTDYNDAYAVLTERVPHGHRAEIKLMVPTTAEVIATGPDGDDVVIGATTTWQPRAIADRLRLTDLDL